MITRRALLFGAATVALTGCREEASSSDPPKIAYGKDSCDRCGMIISEERYAAGLVAKDGDTLLFDDAGEMIATTQEEGLKERHVWVHDYDTKQWIDGTTAYYVASRVGLTPMGTGVIAFADRAAADVDAAANQATVMTWADVLQSWRIAS